MNGAPSINEAARPHSSFSANFTAKGLTLFGFLLLYIPLVVLVTYSFLTMISAENPTRVWTLEWYAKVFSNRDIMQALSMSVWVAVWSTLLSTLLGTLAALALERYEFPGKRFFDLMSHVPLILPEIVMGLSLLIWFVFLNITLGAFSIILAHTTFSLSYVVITVRARLHGFDRSLEEAAQDLGATPWMSFWRVTFPLLWPGILSGSLMAFTLSFDDFLMTFFTAGGDSDTLPIKIYSMVRHGVSPEVNALSTLLLVVTFLVVLLVFNPFQGVVSVLKKDASSVK